MAWANQEILAEVSKMSDDALDAYVFNPEWTVREILSHIIRSSHFYGYRLQLHSLEEIEIRESRRSAYLNSEVRISKSSDVKALLEKLKVADEVLISESQKPEGEIFHLVEKKVIIRSRSTVLFQAVHHATEHRAQLVAALDAKGFGPIDLDAYDMWCYADTHGEFS